MRCSLRLMGWRCAVMLLTPHCIVATVHSTAIILSRPGVYWGYTCSSQTLSYGELPTLGSVHMYTSG